MNISRLTEAAEQALAVRGVVMLSAEGDQDRWCAICAAVDGSLEVRVGEPLGGWRRRRRRQEQEAWLRDHGFVHRIDAWSLPAPLGAAPSWCAATLSPALEHALGVAPDATLAEVLVHPGVLDPADAPAPEAPHVEHVRAALASLVARGRGKVDFQGGRPAATWGWAFAIDGELVLSPESVEIDLSYDEDWAVPLHQAEVGAAAERLTATMHDWAERDPSAPLFIGFMGFSDSARDG